MWHTHAHKERTELSRGVTHTSNDTMEKGCSSHTKHTERERADRDHNSVDIHAESAILYVRTEQRHSDEEGGGCRPQRRAESQVPRDGHSATTRSLSSSYPCPDSTGMSGMWWVNS